MMHGIADLILEWLNASPRRTSAGLSRATGVPPSTISAILAGRKPTLEVSIKLSRVLPRRKVLIIVCQELPELRQLIGNNPEAEGVDLSEFSALPA
jgi:plasmid maintenance system antidote protein VapI